MPGTGRKGSGERADRSCPGCRKGVGTQGRELTPRELELIAWVLPEEREGYREVLDLIRGRNVIAAGRRGEGHIILADPGTVPDHDSPLPQVLAVGEIEYGRERVVVTVREPLGDQVDVEITGSAAGTEARRWTLSRWTPGEPCPKCAGALREVRTTTHQGHGVALVVCARDQRAWVWEERTGVNHPLPVTLFYSQLMKRTVTRDPAIALDSSRLFSALGTFSDADLLGAFVLYNDIRSKLPVDDRIRVPERASGLLARLASFFRRTS